MTLFCSRSIRRTLIASLAALAWLSVCDAAAQTRWAIVIGIDEYESGDIPKLTGAVNDAEAMERAFIDYVEVPPSNIIRLTSRSDDKPTKPAILEALEEIGKSTGPEDLLLFFFAGHAFETTAGFYLMGFDGRLRNRAGDLSDAAIVDSGIEVAFIRRAIERMNVRHRILMIDACRTDPLSPVRVAPASASFESAFVLQPIGGSGLRGTFLSTSLGLNAYEWPAIKRGFFSHFVEEALTGAAAGSSGAVTASSLRDYLFDKVERTVDEKINKDQKPHIDLTGDEVTLVRRERMKTTALEARARQTATRNIYGVVRNAERDELVNATITLRLQSASRGPTLVGASSAGASPPDYETRSDDEGHFLLTGLPRDVAFEIQVELEGYERWTQVATPERDDKIYIYLAQTGTTLASVEPPVTATSPTLTVSRAIDLNLLAAREHATVALHSFLAEEFGAAGDAARKALELDPDNALAHAVLGNVLVSEVTTDETTPAERRAQLLPEARGHIDRALALEPALPIAHNALGLLFYAEGNVEAAEAEFRTAARLDVSLSVAHANLANVYLRGGQLADAERSFRSAIDARRDNAIPYNGLAMVLADQGRFRDAARAARDAISHYTGRDTGLADFYVNLAGILWEDNKLNEARDAVAKARNLGRTSHEVFDLIEGAGIVR